MRYIIKNKIFSIGAGSTVKDEQGRDLFFIKGKMFSPTRMKKIRTMDKKVLFKVRNKFFHIFLPKVFLMDANGDRLLTIKKRKLFSFRKDFTLIPEGERMQGISINGDIIGRHYDIVDNGRVVAHIRRNFNLIKDSFWLDTDDARRAPLYIAMVIALDNFFDHALKQSR